MCSYIQPVRFWISSDLLSFPLFLRLLLVCGGIIGLMDIRIIIKLPLGNNATPFVNQESEKDDFSHLVDLPFICSLYTQDPYSLLERGGSK